MSKNIYIIVLFFILTVFFTYPLTFRMNSVIPSFSSTDESYAVTAYMWLTRYCQKHNFDIKKCNFIAYPFGINLKDYAGTSYLWESIKNFLTILTNHIFAFNLLIILGFILSGWFAYLLTYKLTQSNLAAIFSGLIFAFCPYHFVRIWQHLSLSHIQWMPLYLLSLLSLRDKPGIKNILLVAFSLFLLSSFNFYYAYLMVIATATFIVFVGFQKRKNPKAIINYYMRLFLACFLALVLISPSLWEIYKKKNQLSANVPLEYNLIHRPFNDLISQSARPLSYFLPASVHPVFGNFTEQFIGSPLYGMSFTEHTLYLGWVPLILAGLAMRRWKKRKKVKTIASLEESHSYKENPYIGFFIFLAIVAWFFSQPPWWKIGIIKIYMPSFFMYKIFPMFRAYCRFGIVVMLAVAVLAASGLEFILMKFRAQKTKIAITVLFCALVLFEFWNWPPYKVIDVGKAPAVYYWLAEQPGNFVIAEYPLDSDSSNELYKFYQTKHQKKIINGTVPGTYANKVAKTMTKISEIRTAAALKWMGVKYVLVHKDDYLKTELIQELEELNKISRNPGLKVIKSFPNEQCPQKDIRCIQEIGPVDVYEVMAQPVKPEVKD